MDTIALETEYKINTRVYDIIADVIINIKKMHPTFKIEASSVPVPHSKGSISIDDLTMYYRPISVHIREELIKDKPSDDLFACCVMFKDLSLSSSNTFGIIEMCGGPGLRREYIDDEDDKKHVSEMYESIKAIVENTIEKYIINDDQEREYQK